MIKKIILWMVVLSISAGLIYGGVYRTIARTDTGERENQSERNISFNQGNSGEGNQERGNSRTNGSNEQQERKNESESNRIISDEKFKDVVTFTGIVIQVNENLLMVVSDSGYEIAIENRAWWFATDAGFSAEISDSVALNGFYDTANKFEVSYIENLTKGEGVWICEESGRPLWAGHGRGA